MTLVTTLLTLELFFPGFEYDTNDINSSAIDDCLKTYEPATQRTFLGIPDVQLDTGGLVQFNGKLVHPLLGINGICEIATGLISHDWLSDFFHDSDYADFDARLMQRLWDEAQKHVQEREPSDVWLTVQLLTQWSVTEHRDWESGIVDDTELEFLGFATVVPVPQQP